MLVSIVFLIAGFVAAFPLIAVALVVAVAWLIVIYEANHNLEADDLKDYVKMTAEALVEGSFALIIFARSVFSFVGGALPGILISIYSKYAKIYDKFKNGLYSQFDVKFTAELMSI